jgi:hypothetical protein
MSITVVKLVGLYRQCSNTSVLDFEDRAGSEYWRHGDFQ